jgi:hypothetical protein
MLIKVQQGMRLFIGILSIPITIKDTIILLRNPLIVIVHYYNTEPLIVTNVSYNNAGL